jgi:hypothetical protein
MRKMPFLIFIIVSIIFILSEPGYPSDWKYMGTSQQGDFYLDFESVKHGGLIITFWYMYVDKKGEVNEVRCSINCKNGTIAFREHWEPRPDGSTFLKLYSKGDEDLQWMKIPKGSAWDGFQKSLCKDKGK